MKNYEIRVIPKTAENGEIYWSAYFPAVNNCVGGGETPDEAIKEAYENLNIYLEYLNDEGYPIPDEYEENDFSGKLTLRIGKCMHKTISELAEKDGISINSYINNCLAINIGKDEYKYELKENIEKIQQNTENNLRLSYITTQTVNGLANAFNINQMDSWR